jgi:hypothetical protein
VFTRNRLPGRRWRSVAGFLPGSKAATPWAKLGTAWEPVHRNA